MSLIPHIHRLRSWFLLRPRFWMWVGIFVLFLVAVRIALPPIIKNQINNRLAKVEGYSGAVGDIDLQLFRGAYQLNDITIFRREGNDLLPFFSAKLVDFSLAWGELFHGRFVSDIFIVVPRLQITNTASPQSATKVDAKEEGKRWQDVIQDIFPIEITQLEISRGEINFVDANSTPRVDISVKDLHVSATGLRNSATAESGPYPAVLTAEGISIGNGHFKLFVQGDPLADKPRFMAKLDLQDVDLPSLNDFLRAYANVDVSAGKFQLYMEMDAADGNFSGYVKPFLDHLEFKDLTDEKKGVMSRLWEHLVSGVSKIVKNDDRDQVATRIPFSGSFEKTEVGIWATIVNLVRHGFGRALFEGRDDEPAATQDTRPQKEEASREARNKAASDPTPAGVRRAN